MGAVRDQRASFQCLLEVEPIAFPCSAALSPDRVGGEGGGGEGGHGVVDIEHLALPLTSPLSCGPASRLPPRCVDCECRPGCGEQDVAEDQAGADVPLDRHHRPGLCQPPLRWVGWMGSVQAGPQSAHCCCAPVPAPLPPRFSPTADALVLLVGVAPVEEARGRQQLALWLRPLVFASTNQHNAIQLGGMVVLGGGGGSRRRPSVKRVCPPCGGMFSASPPLRLTPTAPSLHPRCTAVPLYRCSQGPAGAVQPHPPHEDPHPAGGCWWLWAVGGIGGWVGQDGGRATAPLLPRILLM